MTDATPKALRIAMREREGITFEMDALRREEVTRFDRMVDLRQRLDQMDVLIRMLGGEPPVYEPARQTA